MEPDEEVSEDTDSYQNEAYYDSGPFCRHWRDPEYCDDVCKNCGHACHHHYDNCDECDCEDWADSE